MPTPFPLYLITDRHQTAGRPLLDVVGEALAGGVRGVQLREKDLPPRELLELAHALRELTGRFGARLLVNDRVDIALAAKADGVHLGEASIPADAARRLLGPERLIGVSCHSLAGARGAEERGADFITFGPVFFTPSKASYGPPAGVAALAETVRAVTLPVFALGGITRDNVAEVVGAGAAGIALISAIGTAESPREAARNLLSLLPSPSRI
ncbi:thiamine phosphate synthase [Geobacter pickeringii]|uniref:Thiamine-phosphate synthase n=1 Tax=Geobacter pickeringii TaxID=345632 RepID=A0A0B5BI94_9BACT|nr:thiamine phosphate synthase [Geobacter pickeringii]AJE04235.1 thiamine-phosphate synthase [Geobacter pickeringii]